MKSIKNEIIWAQKYRPQTLEDCILPDHLLATFRQFVDNRELPNLILAGHHGIGKTTVARALCAELGDVAVFEINASMNSGIDTLRNDIKAFASTATLTGGRKVVILDEADYLNAQSTQPALRAFMEEFSKACTFILTCNFKARIIEPLQSRCTVIDFTTEKSEKPLLMKAFLSRAEKILEAENIQYDRKVVMALIVRHFPDWRRVINEMQRYSASGKLDAAALSATAGGINELVNMLRAKQFTDMRRWVGENVGQDASAVFRALFDGAHVFVAPDSVPTLILIIADYQYKAAFVADQEVNLVAMLTEIMSECTFV
jgi:DNA polymerase III delta prime subunit